MCRSMAQPVEHHRATPDLTNRIGDAFAGDIGRAAMNRLKKAGKLALRVDVGARRNSNGTGTCRTQIGQDIAEQVAGYNNVKHARSLDEMGGQDIDMKLV